MKIGVLVALVGIVIGIIAINRQPDRSPRLMAIGEYLCRQTIAGKVSELGGSRTVPDVVLVSSSLGEPLSRMKDQLLSGYTISVVKGDGFGEGGGVTHTIRINTTARSLSLRMRYDRSIDRFHMVGYFNSSPTGQ